MKTFIILLVVIVLCSSIVSDARAQRPVSGMPVPTLSMMDDMMQAYMDSFDLDTAVIGFSFLGRIIYLRGFGWADENLTVPLQENATFRVASITKTFTAAVIRDLVDRGMLGLNDLAFNLEGNGGVLDVTPAPVIIDNFVKVITIEHLLHHKGGWDRDLGPDLTSDDLLIQEAMGLAQLPTRDEMMSYILSQELQHPPGSVEAYSNEGFHALGLIAEQVAGEDLLTYVRTRLLPRDLYFPDTELFMGRSFKADQGPREPYYKSPYVVTNVFDPTGDSVPLPYGGYHHEVKDGYGRMVASGVSLLHQAHRFQLNGFDKGVPIDQFHGTYNHGGALPGCSVKLQQRSDGIDFVVLTNVYDTVDLIHSQKITGRIKVLLDQYYIPWPYETVDCVWFDTGFGGSGQGTYDLPFGSVGDLGVVQPYSKVKFKPGSTAWTGVMGGEHLAVTVMDGGSMVVGQ